MIDYKLDLETAFSYELSQRENFPQQAGIYVVKSGERILYVGQTFNLWKRWKGHHKFEDINKIDPEATVHFISVDSGDRELLNQIEESLIESLEPELNIGVRPARKYKKVNREARFNFQFSVSEAERLQRMSDVLEVPQAQIVRNAVKEHLKKLEEALLDD